MMQNNRHEELGPLLVAPGAYLELRSRIRAALGFPTKRLPLLIGIDGEDGSGKSSLAAWLSWQLEMPTIYLDIYLVPNSKPISWNYDDLRRAMDGAQHVPKKRPVIVEGISLLNVLSQVGRTPDFHIFVERAKHKGNMRNELQSYLEEAKRKANYILEWSSEAYDAKVVKAHLGH